MILSNGQAEAEIITNDGDLENYNLNIEELNAEVDEVDIVVYDDEDKVVEEYNDIEQIRDDTYEGQTVTISSIVLSIATLLTVVLVVAAVVVIGGIAYHAATKAYEIIKSNNQKLKQYFYACLANGNVYVAFMNSITLVHAANRIKSGLSVYTFTETQAKTAITKAGFKPISKKKFIQRKDKYIFITYILQLGMVHMYGLGDLIRHEKNNKKFYYLNFCNYSWICDFY